MGDCYPSAFLQILLSPSTVIVRPRIRSLSIIRHTCLSEKEWNCRRGGQLHGSSPCAARFPVLCKCDCATRFARRSAWDWLSLRIEVAPLRRRKHWWIKTKETHFRGIEYLIFKMVLNCRIIISSLLALSNIFLTTKINTKNCVLFCNNLTS